MAHSDDRNPPQRGGVRHENSRDENQYFDSNARHYPVGEYGRDFVSNPDVPRRSGRYPVGDFGRDYEPHDLTGWQRARRSMSPDREQRERSGGDYYGNDRAHYRAGNYDQFADRYYANERRSTTGGADDWSGREAVHRRSNPRAYVGYSGYGGGDYGERRDFEGSLFTGRGDDRIHRMDEGQFRGRGPKGYRRSDERIREDACEYLTEDDDVDASNIEVTVKDCEVTLTGSVSTREQKRRAETVVENLSGVKDVHNRLRVMDETRSSQSGEASATHAQSSQRDQARSGARH